MKRQQTADGRLLLRMLESAARRLEAGAASLDALNVFPVPDGDTGTNMLLTVRAALAAAASLSPASSVSLVSAALARGAMEGARGNSGIILSQFFRGLALALVNRDVLAPADLTLAFVRAESFARRGISNPTEGTILTVLADVARALSGTPFADSAPLSNALETAVAAAAASVERTPSLLAVLREAGVVDSGAEGLLLILQGCLYALQDGEAQAASLPLPPNRPSRLPRRSGSYGFCTEFLLTGQALPLPELRQRLGQEGTSVILVGDETTARIHLHTGRPDAVVAYARSLGEVSHLEVQDLDRQCEEVSPPAGQGAARTDTAVVCLVDGPGLAAVFRSLGAVTVEMEPPEALELALSGAPARQHIRQYILLPNSEEALESARRTPVPAGSSLRVVPSRNVPQGIAALLAFRFDLDLEANVAAMTSALADARAVEVPVGAPDPLAELERRLGEAGGEARSGTVEVVTIYRGAGASPSLAQDAAAACRRAFPGAQIDEVDGGQRRPLLIVSLE